MIKHWIITGDCHGGRAVLTRVNNVTRNYSNYKPEETGVIILGDAGLNFWLNNTDKKYKRELNKLDYHIYCVRGNHEARPNEQLGMHRIHDENVGGTVWVEDKFPNIHYFCDWGHYVIDGLRTLVIGGAYSVDKHYRLARGWKWFEDEQLTGWEMATCERNIPIFGFDLVLSHTCPLSLQPTDLFLHGIDQSTVDNSMEVWMEKLAKKMPWKLWLFGHYHADRIEWPHVEQFYIETEPLIDILERWRKYDETGKLDWWLPLSPKMQKLMEGE